MPTTVHYGRCPVCGAIRGCVTLAEAAAFEEECAAADRAARSAYARPSETPTWQQPKAYL